jgi:YidC/Oxa1 family membrane protein insertase
VILFSILGPFEDLLAAVLKFLHSSVGLPWAWSIVALTILVRMMLVPLTVRQIHSMQNLQAHTPEMKAIQQRYKGDRARMNEELMKFYKENNINPASSCLPIVAQIPVFIALFFVLKGFEKEILPNYPESSLGWLGIVPNITEPANSHWSGYLLLVIYALSQLTSSYFMSATMERTQRIMLIILPLFFLFFILNFPAGLVIYWVTTNLWTTGQGLTTRRLIPRPGPPPKRSSRAAPKEREKPPSADAKAASGAQSDSKPAQTGPPRRVKRKKKARR